MDTALAQLHDRLCALEQENALLRSRLQSCERSHAVLQAEVGEYRRREQEGQESATQEPIAELATLNISTLEHHLLEATAQVANALLTIAPFDIAINTALQILGESLETDRVAVIENVDVPSAQLPYWKILYEWNAPHVPSQLLHPDATQGRYQDLEEWCKRFSQGQGISALLEEVPELLRLELAKVGVKATHAVPIFVEGQWWGVIGFDDCCEAKRRSVAELSVLKIAADCTGSAIQRERDQQALLQAEQARSRSAAKRSKELERHNAELQQANAVILEREREKAILLEITQAIAQIKDTQTLFEAIYSQIQPIFRFDAASVVVLENDTSAYRVLYYENSTPELAEFFASPIQLAGSPFAEVFSPAIADIYPADVDDWLNRYPHYKGLQNAKAVGYRQILVGKFYNSGKLLGLVELVYQQPPVLDEAFCKLFDNFVQQLAIAVANILAHQKIISQQTALLRAEQDRVAELAKTNTALKNSLDRLAAKPDLNAFLGYVLLEIVQQFQVELGYLYLYDAESQTLPLHLYIKQGQVYPQPEVEIPASFLKPAVADLPIWDTLLQTCQPFVITRENAAQYVFRGTYDWQEQQQEHQTGINLLLTLKDEPIGLLALVSTRRSFSPEELELAQALAHQATLALQLTRLAEEAKQAAIAREQEKAAQERVAELAKANAVLKRTAAQLVGQQDLSSFLNSLLLEITQEIGAVNNSIFLCDHTFNFYRMHYCVQDGEVVNLEADPRFEFWQTPTPADNEGWKLIQSRGYMWSVLDIDAIHHDELCDWTIPWHRKMQHRAVMCFLLQIEDKPLGFMGLCFREAIEPSAERISFIQTLANQATLAIHLTRLAEEAKQAAIAREQEKAAQERAAELAKANEVLGRSLNRLANERNLDSFLEHILQEALQMLDGAIAQFFIYDPEADTLMPSIAVDLHGEVLPAPGLMNNLPISESFPATITKAWERMLNQRSPIYFDIIRDADDYWPGTLDWHRSMGHCGAICTALMMGDQPLGMLGLSLRGRSGFTASEFEFFHALAQQATLAIQLTRLAEEAKQAAIAREQEKAAQERAAELAKANDALRRSVGHLTTTDNLYCFLVAALQEAVQASGAETGAIFVYDAPSHSLQVNVLVLKGEVVNIASDPRAELWRNPVPADSSPAWEMIEQRQIVWLSLNQPSPEAWQFAVAWHQQLGHKTIPMIPLAIGDRVLCFLGLAFTTEQPPDEFRFEQCRTFAHHAALALQMADLMQQAKQAAIFEERNRMASEIHDTLAQAFTGISLQLEVAKSLVEEDPQAVQQILNHISQLAEAGLTEARRSVWALYPPATEFADLAQLLYDSVEQMTRNTSTSIEVNLQGSPCSLPPFIGMNLLRIGQEALTNALKHAQAQRITIELVYEVDRILLTIRDNGRGFTLPDTIDNLNGGFGLVGMYERCDRIGAQLSLTSQPGQGTQILVEAPLS